MKKIILASVLTFSLCLLPALAQAQSSSGSGSGTPQPTTSAPPTDETGPATIDDDGKDVPKNYPQSDSDEPQPNTPT